MNHPSRFASSSLFPVAVRAVLTGGLGMLAAMKILAVAEAPILKEYRSKLLAGYEQEAKEYSQALEKSPQDTAALTRRGDARLFLGDAKGAVADFEKEIAIDPSHDAPHWRLGIAYYFAGEFEKSAK